MNRMLKKDLKAKIYLVPLFFCYFHATFKPEAEWDNMIIQKPVFKYVLRSMMIWTKELHQTPKIIQNTGVLLWMPF